MAKLNLTAKDRLLMRRLYPEKSDLNTQTIVQDINSKVMLNDEEREKLQKTMRNTQGAIEWDENAVDDIEVELSNAELNVLKSQVNRLDEEEEITMDLLDLCQKIKGA